MGCHSSVATAEVTKTRGPEFNDSAAVEIFHKLPVIAFPLIFLIEKGCNKYMTASIFRIDMVDKESVKSFGFLH